MKYRVLISMFILFCACHSSKGDLSEKEFYELMKNVSTGWSTQNTTKALSSFHEDAIYMEPPDIQYYRGHAQLKPYFDELNNKYKMKFHNLWFNKKSQSGAGEYTFSYGKDIADVGIVAIELKQGKIKFWREYQVKGPTEFTEFLQIEDKAWEWHIGNYPEPKDSLGF